jgi:RNA polymerase sigma-70 factor, ECF subfamily
VAGSSGEDGLAEGGASNEALLRSAGKGDRAAFRALYHATAPRLFGVCLALLRDRPRAEEVLQEAFARIWEKAYSFDEGKGAALAWMTVLTRRVALNELRRREEGAAACEDMPEIAAEIPEPDPLQKRRLLDCLGKLDASRRQWVLLAYVHGFTHEELARRFQQPPGTMKSALFRALTDLRKCLA